jgi:hypothetical protein
MTQSVLQNQLTLATYEPYHSVIHGGTNVDDNKLLVIYEYNLDEFYNNSWKSELKFYKKQMNLRYRNNCHSLLRNYKNIMKKSNIELVEIIEVDNIMYCILHTYKINILKRKWKKYKLQH